MVWYSHFFQNFPQFVVIHRVKGLSKISKEEVDFYWNSLAFSMIQQMLAILSLVPIEIYGFYSSLSISVYSSLKIDKG